MSHTFRVVTKSLFRLLALMVLALPALVWAGLPHTPKSISGVTVITAEKARSMVEKGVLIVDARVANEYVEEHITGARNIPYKEKSAKSADFDARQDSFDLSKLPANKRTPVIFYCNGNECWKSYKSCVTAVRAGYQSVYWLRGGIPEWKAKGYAVE